MFIAHDQSWPSIDSPRGCVNVFFASRADPPSRDRGSISVIFGGQVLLWVHYWKRDEVSSQRCCDKTMDGQIVLYRESCFPNCTKSWCEKGKAEGRCTCKCSERRFSKKRFGRTSKCSNTKLMFPFAVGGATGNEAIALAAMWKKHYEAILHSPKYSNAYTYIYSIYLKIKI